MIRKILILTVFSVLCLFLPSCKGKETRENPIDIKSPAVNVQHPSSKSPGGVAEGSARNAPMGVPPGEGPSEPQGAGNRMASIPASLFRIPDKKLMTENYNKLRDRMLGDLESELKWQEKLENISNPASGSGNK